jgi:hypothetical protein
MVMTSDRAHGGVTRAQVLQDSMPLSDWLRMAIPPNVSPSGFDPNLGQHFIPIIYLGALTAAFALIGIFVARRRGLAWIALIVVCILIAAGAYFAPMAEVLARLPLTLFRYPARVVPLAALAICALAAFGCDRLIRSSRWQYVIALLIFIDVVIRIQPLLVTAPFNPHRVPYPASIGREAKIVRVNVRPRFDRDAWIAGYLNLYERRFDASTAAPLTSQRYESALDELSGGYVIAPLRLPSFELLMSGRGALVYRNRAALPLAYVRDDATHRVSRVSTLAFTPSAVFIEVDNAAAGDVVVTQQTAAGWHVSVDGIAANPHETSLFRAVHVGRGHHKIQWTYRPLSLFIGALLTLAALVRLLFSHRFVKHRERETFLRASVELRSNFQEGGV